VREDDLAAEAPSDELRQLLAFELARARRLLDEGTPLVRSLSGLARLAVAGYVGGGRAALDEIEASGYDVLRRSPKAGRAPRLAQTAAVLREAGR
jgi:phytoene/squalene synthetase